jgi:hypothetical protein
MFGKVSARLRLLRPGFVLALALLTVGCSSKGTVSGKVIYKGKPLAGGMVTFVPEGGGAAVTAPIQEDGSYTIAKIPPGPVKIAVFLPKPEVKTKSKLPADVPEEGAKMFASREGAGRSGQGDPKLGDPNQSGLTYTVISGAQNHDIEIK